MKKSHWILTFLCLLMILSITNLAYAESDAYALGRFLGTAIGSSNNRNVQKSEWYNKNFDVTKIKTVVLLISSKMEANPYSLYVLNDFESLMAKKLEEKNVVAVPFGVMLKSANEFYNNKISTLFAQEKYSEFLELLKEYIKNNYDAVLAIDVYQMATGSQYVSGYSYQTTEYTGNGYQVLNHTVPASYAKNATVHASFLLKAAYDDEIIFTRNECITAKKTLLRKSTTPELLLDKMGKAFISDIYKYQEK